MNLEKLEEFIKLAKESGVEELRYEGEKEEYFVKLPYAKHASTMVSPAVNQPQTNTGGAVAASTKSDFIEITSPFVGTFYKSASPESAAYVKVGDRISNGQVLCIVEAMKIMNEIESEISGEIVEICAENETYVEFGQVLFKVKP